MKIFWPIPILQPVLGNRKWGERRGERERDKERESDREREREREGIQIENFITQEL